MAEDTDIDDLMFSADVAWQQAIVDNMAKLGWRPASGQWLYAPIAWINDKREIGLLSFPAQNGGRDYTLLSKRIDSESELLDWLISLSKSAHRDILANRWLSVRHMQYAINAYRDLQIVPD